LILRASCLWPECAHAKEFGLLKKTLSTKTNGMILFIERAFQRFREFETCLKFIIRRGDVN
jgi:hypothetical protein